MPELPDVEVYRQYVDATSLHQEVEKVEIGAPRMLKAVAPRSLRSRLEGGQLNATRRHGKHLLIELSRGPWLALHFGMTGRLDYAKRADGAPRHTRLSIAFANGYRLAGIWQRRLGEIAVASDPDSFVADRDLGPDALEIEPAGLERLLAGRRGALKSALMDQSLLAGIGNVYSDEILFQAQLHPGREVRGLDGHDLARLHRAMRHVLRLAIERRADPEQVPRSWLLRRRGPNRRCPCCRAGLAQATIGGRRAYFCPHCQH